MADNFVMVRPTSLLLTRTTKLLARNLPAVRIKIEDVLGVEPHFLRYLNTTQMCDGNVVPTCLQEQTVVTSLISEEMNDGGFRMMAVEVKAGDFATKRGWVEVVSTHDLRVKTKPPPEVI
jgi:hypothetical protein